MTSGAFSSSIWCSKWNGICNTYG